jgi:hypothetical protein
MQTLTFAIAITALILAVLNRFHFRDDIEELWNKIFKMGEDSKCGG